MMARRVQAMGLLIGVGLIVAAGLIDLDRLPALWWDEGWTMNVARNWIERGQYGQLLNGQPAPAGLSAAFPAVASVALSFDFFGIGVWQARLPSVIYTLAALGLLYWLGRRLFDRTVALTAVTLLLITAADPLVNPLFVGRQVLAEPVMLVCLLGGYACLGSALIGDRSWPMTGLSAIGLFALGLMAKAQPLPFWAASLVLPVMTTLMARQWRMARLLAINLVGGYGLMRLLMALQAAWFSPIVPATTIGLLDVTAVVLVPQVRLLVAAVTLEMALPTILGLITAARQLLKRWRPARSLEAQDLVRLTVFGFAASWLAWYVLLSRGTPRYAMPGLFMGSLFAASLVVKAIRRIRQRRSGLANVGSWVLIGVLIAMLVLNATWVTGMLRANVYPGVAAQDTAEYINQHAPADALVETYESEVMFYLQRRYHFPPDEMHVELARQFLNEYNQGRQVASNTGLTVNYDPLSTDPDYVIVGPSDQLWYVLYRAVLASGAIKPVFAAGRYEVFERVR